MKTVRRGTEEYCQLIRRAEAFAMSGCEELWLQQRGYRIKEEVKQKK